jgi:hypothetical protein
VRRLAVSLLAAFALGGWVAGSIAANGATFLKVTYWKDGSRLADRVTWTLGCNPARGTLSRPVVACRRLKAGGVRLFAPLPKDIVCTQIYGGPQMARVIGVVQGERVWATFQRRNGCEIGRWNGLSPWLLPPGGVS